MGYKEGEEDFSRKADYKKEFARRMGHRAMMLMQESLRTQQKRIDRIGRGFQTHRLKLRDQMGQTFSLRTVSEMIGVETPMITFLESGMVTKEEMLDVISKWATFFNRDPEDYKQMLLSE